MNRVELIGRLTADVKFAEGQTAVARYTLAVDRIGDGADFPTVVAFGKAAEFANKYFKKGMRVGVCGRLQTGSYEKNGVKHYTFDVVAENQEFADGKKQDEITEELPFT